MANLLNQFVDGPEVYKGLLNLNTLNSGLTGALQAVTDGMGVASPLQLSNSQAAFAGFASAPIGDIVWRANGTLTDYTGWHQSDGNFKIMTKNNASIFINVSNSILFLNGLSAQATITSNGSLGLGLTSGLLARHHVRGDGTNSVFRAESNTGANFVTINNSGQLVFGSAGANEPTLVNYNGISTESGTGNALRIRQRANINGTLIQYWADGLFNNTTSGINISHHFLSSGYAGGAGNGNYRATQIEYTINNSGAQTGTATGIFLNATETNLNGMGHNLIDLQKDGVSRFTVRAGGSVVISDFAQFGASGARINGSGSDILVLRDTGGTTFNRLSFGGTTNAFPAMKRNGAGLQIRTADDSGFSNLGVAGVDASSYLAAGGVVLSAGSGIYTGNSANTRLTPFAGGFSVQLGGAALDASSIFQINSTTQGFLPPRMTTAQRDAIASPAEGLMIYNTTTSAWNGFKGTTWVAL